MLFVVRFCWSRGYDIDLGGLFTGPTTSALYLGKLIGFRGDVYETWIGPAHFETTVEGREGVAPDADGDGVSDDQDNCRAIANPTHAHRDADLIGDACDLCPDYASTNNNDLDHNGIGDICECGDQTQDGTVNVQDLVGINLAIFGAVQPGPLCDANNDGLCNVQDIVAGNQKIFGRPAYCSRYLPPMP
jgi:thrombospondin type 3 repeat protein